MLLGIAFFLVFFDLAENLLHQELRQFDQNISNVFFAIRSPILTEVVKIINAMGSAILLITMALIVIGYLWLVKKSFADSVMLAVAISGAALMNLVLKMVFHRTRPSLPTLAYASGFSFPSGHAMVSFVFYGMLIFLLWNNFGPSKWKYVLTSILAVLTLGIGISRVYLGVHYPSDVIAGFAAGGIWLTGCILALQTFRYLRRDRAILERMHKRNE